MSRNPGTIAYPHANVSGDQNLPSIDRRALLKVMGAATLAAPGLSLLQGLTSSGSAAYAEGGREAAASSSSAPTVTLGGASVRPPSIPLAVRSPYLSSWLPATSLTAATPQFWNGNARGLAGLVTIDGQLYAWAGQPTLSSGTAVTAMTPTATEVTATRSIFTAEAGGVQLVAEWLSPVEPGNLELQSAPLTLLTVTVSFTDGQTHDVAVYADITGEWASSNESAEITWAASADSTAQYWEVSLASPQPLSETTQMANWGSVVWAAPASSSLTYQAGDSTTIRSQFAADGALLNSSDTPPRAVNDDQPAFAFAVDLGSTAGSASFVLGHVRTPLISYGQSATQLQPLWTNYWSDWQEMTAAFVTGASSARQRAIALDAKVQNAATAAGGSGYAAACALALRQCYGGTELAIGPGGDPWLLGKEISSNGDTNTVDIFDQAFLAWLWLDPGLIPLVMAPILNWCASPAWQTASAWSGISQPYYCVHDLGTYPVASGRVPGNNEQMPIEESAGMLIMAAAYARAVGASAAEPFLSKWQTLWGQWAQYLMSQVPTPATQLTTDDWAPGYATVTGSVNLGIKAIIGLMAASQIAAVTGDSTDASTWSEAATANVGPWVSLSTDSYQGNFLNLAQGASGTWSSLYNAYYESVIGVSLVPDEVAAEQAAFYLKQLTTYGMGLQTGAGDMNKVAWLFYLPVWLNGYEIAEQLMQRNVAYINDTPSLVPYGDRYHTSTGVEAPGIQAHPTLGAVFSLLASGIMLSDGTPAPSTPPVATTSKPTYVKVTQKRHPKPSLTVFISDGGLAVSHGEVGVRVHASSEESCHGELELRYTGKAASKHRGRHGAGGTLIGYARYSVPANETRLERIKLTSEGLALLGGVQSHRLQVLVRATVAGGMSASKHAVLHESHPH